MNMPSQSHHLPPLSAHPSTSHDHYTTRRSSQSTVAPLRGLPAFGTPNEFPNPPSHYFPSRPRPPSGPGVAGNSSASAAGAKHGDSSAVASTSTSVDQRLANERDAQLYQKAGYGDEDGAFHHHHHRGHALDSSLQAAGNRTSVASSSDHPWSRTDVNGGDSVTDAMAIDTDNEEDLDENDIDLDDNASIHSTGKRSAPGGKESSSSKKRSRTLTTAHQTAVLNALLAKTRFPSTETREEVGKQIGMSARRVQIWFQNRRQSQKRLRDRDANELGVASTSNLPHHEYQRADPYARYPGPMSSASSGSTARPALSRQQSVDSVASYSSAQSSALSYHRGDILSPISDQPPRWSTGSSDRAPAPVGYGGWMSTPPDRRETSASAGYFAGAVPGRQQALPMTPERGSIALPKTPGPAETGGHVRLPSLSAVLGDTAVDRSPFANTHPYNRGGPPPAPSSGSRNIMNASNRPFDDFSRLKISGGDSDSINSGRERHSSPPDLLDAAMETMFRPSALPARSALLPLRNIFGPPPTAEQLAARRGASEADAALLAPILPSSEQKQSNQQPPKLPPLSSLLPNPHVFPSTRSVSTSQQSMASSNAGRSSISSFDTLPTTSNSIASSNTSRTSFSSEVQEEWDRMTSGVGRKVKTAEIQSRAVDGGPLMPNSRRLPSTNSVLSTTREVGIELP